MSDREGDVGAASRWLLLVHQLPAKPAYLRVKVWRRLQGLGAVAMKNAVYALPASEQAQEDFEWLLREIVQGGGEAFICEARLVEGLTDAEVRALFDRARDEDYEAIASELRAFAEKLRADPSAEQLAEARNQLARLKARQAQIAAIDFFGADGRQAAEALLTELEAGLRHGEPATEPSRQSSPSSADLKARAWVTRRDVFVDRIASAWLIRRFIDPEARFKFVPAKGYMPETGELRFDMFEAEFTHEGDRCTFEVLLERTGLNDPALKAIAEIIHDLDLKDGKFGRAEAGGIGSLITGLCAATNKDPERLARGEALFDDLHQFFRRRRP
jgi:hypothetical protein